VYFFQICLVKETNEKKDVIWLSLPKDRILPVVSESIKNKWNSAINIAFEVEVLFARLINIGKTVPFHKKNLFVVHGNVLWMIGVIQRSI